LFRSGELLVDHASLLRESPDPSLRSRPLYGAVASCHVARSMSSVHIMEPTPKRVVPGAQAIARAARLLRLVTAGGETGVALQDLASAADLSRSTAHRLLTALRAEGLVDRDAHSARWMPGPELYLMGTVAAARYDVTALARDIVRSLAVK